MRRGCGQCRDRQGTAIPTLRTTPSPHSRGATDTRGGGCARCVLSGDVAESAGHLVWIDCEMTGLDLRRDALIEVAALVTDYDLNVLGEGIDIVIKPPPEALEQMGDYVRSMHEKSGLLDHVIDFEVVRKLGLKTIGDPVTITGIAPSFVSKNS